MKFPSVPNSNSLFSQDTGTILLTPVKDYGLPLVPTDLLEATVNFTIDRTYEERKSVRDRTRPTILRRLTATNFTFELNVQQESAIARLMKNVGRITGVLQAAAEGLVIPGRNGGKAGTAIYLPRVGVYDLEITIGGQPASLTDDFFVQPMAGVIWLRKDIVGAIAGTYSCMEYEIPRQTIAELEEVQMSMTIIKDVADDINGTIKVIPLVGFTPSNAIGEITDDQGGNGGGFTISGTVYDPGDGFGHEDVLPSKDELDAWVLENAA